MFELGLTGQRIFKSKLLQYPTCKNCEQWKCDKPSISILYYKEKLKRDSYNGT
jgi:hypothetical protein